MLLQYGASLGTTDMQGRSCLQLAQEADNKEVLDIVLSYHNH